METSTYHNGCLRAHFLEVTSKENLYQASQSCFVIFLFGLLFLGNRFSFGRMLVVA